MGGTFGMRRGNGEVHRAVLGNPEGRRNTREDNNTIDIQKVR